MSLFTIRLLVDRLIIEALLAVIEVAVIFVELIFGTVNFVDAFKLEAFTITPFTVVELTVVILPVGTLNSVNTLKLVQVILVLQLISDVLISIPVTIFAFSLVEDMFVKLQLIHDILDIFIFGRVLITSFKILMFAPAVKDVPPPVADITLLRILMFVPAVRVGWTLGATILVAVMFVADRLIVEILLALTLDTLEKIPV